MEISEEFIDDITDKIKRNKSVRRKLPGGGKISIERKLPFLTLYRFKEKPLEDHLVQVVLTGSSYLVVPGGEEYYDQVKNLLYRLIEVYTKEFESFMILEVWPSAEFEEQPAISIKCPEKLGQSTVKVLQQNLQNINKIYPALKVERKCVKDRHPTHMPALFNPYELKENEVLFIGIEVPKIYMSTGSTGIFPLFFREFRRLFTEAVQKTFYDFVRVQTTFETSHYHELGRSQIDSTVWHIDKKLAEIERSFEFLLLVAPINSDQEWEKFKENKFRKNPTFRYRLLPIDPEQLKRKLYNLNFQKIHDPALAYLLRDKRDELEIQLTMLNRRNSKDFFYNSMRLYRGVDNSLLNLAKQILHTLPPVIHNENMVGKSMGVTGEEFAAKAEEEFAYYRQQNKHFNTQIQLRDDIPGLMVSHGNLLIPKNMSISKNRVEALIHHEVGTHVLTFVNGREHSLQQMRYGLADYDELQEGLAVLSEYLGGELNIARLRLLACRVVAANSLLEGGDFTDTFNLLCSEYGIGEETAWDISTRIHQSGGFIKDVIYLRGLVHLMHYLEEGGELEPLFIGKIAAKHIPIVKELQSRKVLKQTSLLPRYLKTDKAMRRLRKVKEGLAITDLIEEKQTA